MKPDKKKSLATAIRAARKAGALMRQNLGRAKRVNSASQHDIKLELDVRCQRIIEGILRRAFPRIPVLGEEGISGDPGAELRWVVDPIDGTVNFAYGIPHACVSIALQARPEILNGAAVREEDYATVVGVVYDPFCDELWTATSGGAARLNGKIIRVSERTRLAEAVVSIGFAKSRGNLDRTLPFFNELARRVRKVRLMGAAALAMTYVASGRFDAYVERGIRLWDIAAGGLIVECAGGEFRREPIPGDYAYRMIVSNRKLGPRLAALQKKLQPKTL